MPDVSFEEEKNVPAAYVPAAQSAYREGGTGLYGFLIRRGIVKDRSGASKIMLITAAVCFLGIGISFIAAHDSELELPQELIDNPPAY